MLTFDLAGLYNVVGERQQTCLISHRCTDIDQPPEEQPLRPTDFCKRASQRREVVTPLWPVGGLPDIKIITVIHAVIINRFHRTGKPIAARNAAIDTHIVRETWTNDSPCKPIQVSAPAPEFQLASWIQKQKSSFFQWTVNP